MLLDDNQIYPFKLNKTITLLVINHIVMILLIRP